jgi:hypothetical protein
MRRRLRLFIDNDGLDEELKQPEVSMELQEFTQILKDAIVWDRAWLNDLGDEQVRISSDLYEVLVTYSQMRPSA